MDSRQRRTRPGDLPNKRVRAPDGKLINVKVVKADSQTFASDFLAAFQANVKRVRAEARKPADASKPAKA